MDNTNLNNNSNSVSALEDYMYEIENVKKIRFFADLFYRFKKNRNQKLLPAPTFKTSKTFKSISYLWFFGDIKNSLFSSLDNIRNSIFFKNNSISKNTYEPEIITSNNIPQKTTNENNYTSEIIIPKPKN